MRHYYFSIYYIFKGINLWLIIFRDYYIFKGINLLLIIFRDFRYYSDFMMTKFNIWSY